MTTRLETAVEPLKQGVYVAIGAADLAAEKVREIPVIDRARSRSLLEQFREVEPKLRKEARELATRGERTVSRFRKRAERARSKARTFPTETRKQVAEFRADPRKQVAEFRNRMGDAFGLTAPRTVKARPKAPAKASA